MTIIHGDCIEVMNAMEPENIDAICTDPPYGLEFMGKAWDTFKETGNFPGGGKMRDDYHAPGRTAKLTQLPAPRYVAGEQAQQFHARWAEAAYRVAKPSAYLLAFGGTRTVHRMTTALEDAGWIIRDMLVWAYASGFPKSKASLKPAWEPIVMARKPGPLRMLAIDECRIGLNGERVMRDFDKQKPEPWEQLGDFPNRQTGTWENTQGRWPANVILTDPIFDGGVEGVVGGGTARASGEYEAVIRGDRLGPASIPLDNGPQYSDSGTYSRFFLIPKADRSDREPVLGGLPQTVVSVWGGDEDDLTPGKKSTVPRRNVHPTVKPTDLMRHLVRLVTPPGGTVLDCFAGSGTTALAAEMEGFPWIAIEREAEYVEIMRARLNGTQRGLGLVG